MALKQERVLIQDGYDIGIGVASATGSPMALGAIGAVTPPQVGTGGSGSFVFRRIDSNDELETELGISADASAGVGLFSGSASFDFSKQCKIQTSSLTVLVAAEEKFAFQQMDSPYYRTLRRCWSQMEIYRSFPISSVNTSSVASAPEGAS